MHRARGHDVSLKIYMWRGLLLAAAFVLAWLSLANGVGSYYANRVAAGDDALIENVLVWNPDHSGTLFRKALKTLPEEPEAATRLLEQAYRANSTDPFPLIALSAQAFDAGDMERGDALIELASRLAPVDPRVQEAAATYWGKRGRYDRMIAHWSTTLEADRSRRDVLFPRLLALAENPESRALLEPLASSPPSWWTDFFRYVSRSALESDAVRYLYASRRQSTQVPVSLDERADYVARLQKDGSIAEAYLVWMSGLDETARRQLGLLFDGGFDLPISGQGFGWRVARHDHFSAEPAPTHGATGRSALRVRFRRFEGSFRHVAQPLFLDPGTYRLTGRARIDSLDSKGGVKWTLRCVQPESTVLGDGPRLLGSSDWSDFGFDFEVPSTCQYQQLILVSGGTRSFEQKLDGVIWFDDMKIARTAALDAAARVDAALREGASPAPASNTADAAAQ
jgi:hypothetical protein